MVRTYPGQSLVIYHTLALSLSNSIPIICPLYQYISLPRLPKEFSRVTDMREYMYYLYLHVCIYKHIFKYIQYVYVCTNIQIVMNDYEKNYIYIYNMYIFSIYDVIHRYPVVIPMENQHHFSVKHRSFDCFTVLSLPNTLRSLLLAASGWNDGDFTKQEMNYNIVI